MSNDYHRLKVSQFKKSMVWALLGARRDLPSLRHIPFTPKPLGSPWDLQLGEQQAVAENSPFASVTSFPDFMQSLPSSPLSLSRNFSWIVFKMWEKTCKKVIGIPQCLRLRNRGSERPVSCPNPSCEKCQICWFGPSESGCKGQFFLLHQTAF